jgi:hypothetical protein
MFLDLSASWFAKYPGVPRDFMKRDARGNRMDERRHARTV